MRSPGWGQEHDVRTAEIPVRADHYEVISAQYHRYDRRRPAHFLLSGAGQHVPRSDRSGNRDKPWRRGQFLPRFCVRHGTDSTMMRAKSRTKPRRNRPANAAGETTPAPSERVAFKVIAMATSVGGLKALSVILSRLPADFPAAIAIVMHLSPDHQSILAELLDRRTQLVVKQAHSGDVLSPRSVFVAPPNHHLSVAKGGRLELSSPDAEKIHYARPSAEPLFASVAHVYGSDAIAVVLTGGDGDGSFGVQIIKDKGGTVIAQDRPTSENFSMPETSIETGDVDFILPLDEIASKLMELVGVGKQQEDSPGQRVTPTRPSGGTLES